MKGEDFAAYYYNEFPVMTDDNQKPAEPSYYVCKRVNTHDATCFIKCNSPRDLEQFKESPSGVWLYQITMCFNCKGVPIRSADHGYYVVYKRVEKGWEDDPSLYFEKVTETECISFSALLKLPYHNLFDE